MATKKTKKKVSKKNSNIVKYLALVPYLFAIAGICMIFLTFVNGTGNVLGSEVSYTGLQTIFGYSKTTTSILNSSITTTYLNFSIVGFIALLLPVIGIVAIPVLKSKLSYLVSALCFIASAVLFILMPNFVVFTESYKNLYTLTLGIGAILACVFNGIAGLVSGYLFYASKK